jgi:hypothetical protein
MAKATKRPQVYLTTHKRVKAMAKREKQLDLKEFYDEIINLGITHYEIKKLRDIK